MRLPEETSGQKPTYGPTAFFYHTTNEKLEALSNFFLEAVQKDRKIIVVLPGEDRQASESALLAQNLVQTQLNEEGRINIKPSLEVITESEDILTPNLLKGWLDCQVQLASQDGLSGLQIWMELTREVLKPDGVIQTYEWFTKIVADDGLRASIMCAYDQTRIELHDLLGLLQIHPLLFLSNQVIQNPMYKTRGSPSNSKNNGHFAEILSIIRTSAANAHPVELSDSIHHLLVESLPFGTLLCDNRGKIIYSNPMARCLLGYTQYDGEIDDNLLDLVDSEERKIALQEIFSGIKSDQQEFNSLECRLATRSGEPTPVELKCKWFIDPGTARHLMLCHFIDISHHYEIEQALRASEQRYRFLVEYQGEGVVMIDTGGRINYINEAGAKLVESTPNTINGRPLMDFIPDSQTDLLKAELENRRKGLSSSYELTLISAAGNLREVLVTATPRYTSDGIYNGTLAIFRDITERKQLEEKLRYQSTHDAMTNLYNRTFFDETIQTHDLITSPQTSIIIVDVDGLKEVNDQDGHRAGDQLIQKVARFLIASFRNKDVIARIGGDEFAILLFDTDETQLHQAILRLRHNLEKANANLPEQEQISFSIGGATTNPNRDINQTLMLADLRMYRQKRRKKAAHGSQLVE